MGLPVTVSHVAAVTTVRSFSKRLLDSVLGSAGTASDWAAQDLLPCSFLSRAALCLKLSATVKLFSRCCARLWLLRA